MTSSTHCGATNFGFECIRVSLFDAAPNGGQIGFIRRTVFAVFAATFGTTVTTGGETVAVHLYAL